MPINLTVQMNVKISWKYQYVKLTQEEIYYLNHPVTMKEIKLQLKTFPQRKQQV